VFRKRSILSCGPCRDANIIGCSSRICSRPRTIWTMSRRKTSRISRPWRSVTLLPSPRTSTRFARDSRKGAEAICPGSAAHKICRKSLLAVGWAHGENALYPKTLAVFGALRFCSGDLQVGVFVRALGCTALYRTIYFQRSGQSEPGENMARKRKRQQRKTRTIEGAKEWKLTGRDREAFANALLNPRVPNGRIKRAVKRYTTCVIPAISH